MTVCKKLLVVSLILLTYMQSAFSQCERGVSGDCGAVSFLGDSLVSENNFAELVQKSCVSGTEECVLERLTTNYYRMFSGIPTTVCVLDGTHGLWLDIRKTKTETEEHIEVCAKISVDNLPTDSLLCYEYYNNADILSCYEQLYYVSIPQLKVWTVRITYDEDSAEADDTDVFSMDLKHGCFKKCVEKVANW